MPAIWSFNSAQHQLQGVIKFKFVNFKLFYPIFFLFVGSLSLFCIFSSVSFTHHAIIERTLW